MAPFRALNYTSMGAVLLSMIVVFTFILLILICASCCGGSNDKVAKGGSKRAASTKSKKAASKRQKSTASKKIPSPRANLKKSLPGGSVLTGASTSTMQGGSVLKGLDGKSGHSFAASQRPAQEQLEFASESDPRYKSLAELE